MVSEKQESQAMGLKILLQVNHLLLSAAILGPVLKKMNYEADLLHSKTPQRLRGVARDGQTEQKYDLEFSSQLCLYTTFVSFPMILFIF